MTPSVATALPAPGVRPVLDARHRRARRRVRVAAGALVVVAAVVGTWLGVRAQVRLTAAGSTLVGFDESGAGVLPPVAEDPAPGAAVAVHTWRNDGPVTVRLTVPDAPPDGADGYGVVRSTDLVAPGDADVAARGRRSVTLAPGEEVGVRLVLGFGCAGTNAGIAYGAPPVVLEATALGLTRTLTLPLDPVPMVRSSTGLPSTC